MLFAKTEPRERILRQFAGIGLIALTLLLVRLIITDADATPWTVAASLVGWIVCAIGLLRPRVMSPIWTAWLVVTYPIAWAVSHLVLLVLYFGILSPLGLLVRTLRRSALDRGFDDSTRLTSYWSARDATFEPSRYLRQF